MTKDKNFLIIERKDPGLRPREERLGDYLSVEQQLSDFVLREQSTRCMNCGTPFCHGSGCPLGNLIPEFNQHVVEGRWQAALDILLATNCFPEFTARVCPALCEGSCVLGLSGQPVTVRQIELAIIEKGFKHGHIAPNPPKTRHHKRAAIVGSGPAGLAAAHILNRAGYNVVVFENAAKPGGMLRYGIPDFKLEKWVVNRRIELMQEEGVVFETGVEIGKDISLRYLKHRFDCGLLAVGATLPRDIDIPGRKLKGIHFALDYLVQQNRRIGGEFIRPEDEIMAHKKHVVVIGGGDTGSDCVGTALRQGAEDVVGLEILPRPPFTRSPENPWPQYPKIYRESSSHREGGERLFSVMAEKFEGDEDGNVKQVHCAEVEWTREKPGEPPQPKKIPGSEFVKRADLVLIAMGFVGPRLTQISKELDLTVDAKGYIPRDKNGMTAVSGVFIAGDMALGPSLVVSAIADGRRAAEGMVRFLENRQG